jgi:hypothetical protein
MNDGFTAGKIRKKRDVICLNKDGAARKGRKGLEASQKKTNNLPLHRVM